jgi:hypothetical protein
MRKPAPKKPAPTRKTAKSTRKSTKKAPGKKQRMSVRERKFFKHVAEGMSAQEAARKAGYAESFCKTKAYVKVSDGKFTEVLDKAGVTDEKIAETVLNGLDADKVISANVHSPTGEGMADAHGTTKDFIEVPDHPTRLKAADMAAKMKDHYPKEKTPLEDLNDLAKLINEGRERVKK